MTPILGLSRKCNVCGFYVEASHSIDLCIEQWAAKLRALIAEANQAMKKKEVA